MMDKLELYNKVRKVPKEAQKPIQGGRLSGFTDINPMWRIKTLTEQFGECGFGWYFNIIDKWQEQGANGEIAVFVEISMYVKRGDEWSQPIQGIGGSMLVSKETKGLYTSDECYKMALTDAISVACKSLGFGADIYWNGDSTKYNKRQSADDKAAQEINEGFQTAMDTTALATAEQVKKIREGCFATGYSEESILKFYKINSLKELTVKQADYTLRKLNGKADKAG
jgi:hypothetical protein